jgi:hypothetical protein
MLRTRKAQYKPNPINPNQLKGLISAGYQRNGPAREIASKQGYKLIDKFSNAERKVFEDNKGNPYIVNVGTRKFSDWGTNIALGVGLGRFTNRFKDSKNLVEKVKKEYKDKKITNIGDSLGGALAENSGGDRIITTNKAAGIGSIFKNISGKQTDIRTGSDPVSILARTQFGGNRYTIPRTNFLDPLKAHSYKNLNRFDKTIN